MRKKRSFLTMQEAIEVFYELADDEKLLHFVTEEGCASRAFKVDLHFKLMGFQSPDVIYAFAKEGEVLVVENDVRMQEKSGIGGWRYHVAISLPVELEGGAIVDLVFDPSLFDGPVTKKQWAKEMNAHRHMLRSDSSYKPVRVIGRLTEECSHIELGGQRDFGYFSYKYKKTQTHDRRVVGVSQICNSFFAANRELDIKRKRFGNTWTTHADKKHCAPRLIEVEKKPRNEILGFFRNGK